MSKIKWKLVFAIQCALFLAVSAQLIADPSLNSVITLLDNVTFLGDLRIRPDADTFKLYWFDNNQKVFVEGPNIKNFSPTLNGLDGVRFDLLVDSDSTSLLVATYNKLGGAGIFYVNAGGPLFISSPPCSMLYEAPKAIFYQYKYIMVSFALGCPLSIDGNFSLYSKFLGQISFAGGIVSSASWNMTTAVTANSFSNDVAFLDDSGLFISVWNNKDLNIVQGSRNTIPVVPMSPFYTILPYSCSTPIVVNNALYCVNASDSTIIEVSLSTDGLSINERSLGTFGEGLVGHMMRGSRQNITVLGYINRKRSVCLQLKSIQYPLYTRPICWLEKAATIDSLAITSLTNDSIVVAYFAIGLTQSTIKTQLINMTCGDGFLGPNEECDSVPGCNAECRCDTGYNLDPKSNNCIFDTSAPMPASAEVVPLLDCFVPLNNTHVRGYFSYNNLQNQSVQVLIGSENYFTKIGSDVGQPTIFSPGHISFFPASAFAVTWNKQAIEWHLTSGVLAVDPATNAQLCPIDVTIEVNVIVSRVPNTTELAQIGSTIASYIGVDPSRVKIDVRVDGSNIILVITIIGDGSDVLSALIAEKLVNAIKNDSEKLEESVKDIVPIVINKGTVRGQPTLKFAPFPQVPPSGSGSVYITIHILFILALGFFIL